MRDENNNRKEVGTHLKWKKHIAGNEGIGQIRVRLPQTDRVETDQSPLNVRENSPRRKAAQDLVYQVR